jgi:hypothetical protein
MVVNRKISAALCTIVLLGFEWASAAEYPPEAQSPACAPNLDLNVADFPITPSRNTIDQIQRLGIKTVFRYYDHALANPATAQREERL